MQLPKIHALAGEVTPLMVYAQAACKEMIPVDRLSHDQIRVTCRRCLRKLNALIVRYERRGNLDTRILKYIDIHIIMAGVLPTGRDIQRGLGLPYTFSVSRALNKLVSSGKLEKLGWGTYAPKAFLQTFATHGEKYD